MKLFFGKWETLVIHTKTPNLIEVPVVHFYLTTYNIAFLITNFNALPFFQPAELLVSAATVGSTYIERVAARLYGLDDFL